MRLPPLTDGRVLRRYKRFLAEVELADGRLVTAHCPNTGSMRTCWAPGAPVQLSHSDDPRRKLAWTWERVDMGRGWIGINTHRVNAVVAEGIAQGRVPALAGYPEPRREPRLDLPGLPAGRLDLALGNDCLVEVKNVTLWEGGCLSFPDAVTVRGRRHLDLLAALAVRGLRAVLLFALNRPEGTCFSPAAHIDPAYAHGLAEAAAAGVEVLAVRVRHRPQAMELGEGVEVRGERGTGVT